VKLLNYCSILFLLQLIIILGQCHVGLSLIANNPFATSNVNLKNIKGTTPDGKYLVEIQYSPEQASKGKVTFLRIDLFDNTMNNQTRLRHVDCDLIIEKDRSEVFKLSSKYGESLYHSISGTFLASYQFNETGVYIMSVELSGINFVPIVPVFVSFIVSITDNETENLSISSAS
jgi:hypothetical protein